MTDGKKLIAAMRPETKHFVYAPCMMTLLLSSFLQDGHIGSRWSSFFSVDEPSAGVESADREDTDEVWNENWTGIRCFKL